MELKKKEQPKEIVKAKPETEETVELAEEYTSQKNAAQVTIDKKFVTIRLLPGIIEHMSNHFSYDYMVLKFRKDGGGGCDVTAYRDSQNVGG